MNPSISRIIYILSYVLLVPIHGFGGQDIVDREVAGMTLPSGISELLTFCQVERLLCGWEIANGDAALESPSKPTRVAITKGSSVRQVLDEIATRHPRYAWRAADGIINILPKKGEAHLKGGRNPLDTNIANLHISSKTIYDAALMACQAAAIKCEPPTIMVGGSLRFAVVSLDIDGISLREALNRLIQADGAAYWVMESPEQEEGAYVLRMGAFRRKSVGGAAPK